MLTAVLMAILWAVRPKGPLQASMGKAMTSTSQVIQKSADEASGRFNF